MCSVGVTLKSFLAAQENYILTDYSPLMAVHTEIQAKY